MPPAPQPGRSLRELEPQLSPPSGVRRSARNGLGLLVATFVHVADLGLEIKCEHAYSKEVPLGRL